MIATNTEVDRTFISDDEHRSWSARAAGHVRSILMAAGVALLVPIGIVVLPVALAVRAVLSETSWRRIAVWK